MTVQFKTFMYLENLISQRRQEGFEKSLINHSRIHGIKRRHFGKQIRKETLLKFHVWPISYK